MHTYHHLRHLARPLKGVGPFSSTTNLFTLRYADASIGVHLNRMLVSVYYLTLCAWKVHLHKKSIGKSAGVTPNGMSHEKKKKKKKKI